MIGSRSGPPPQFFLAANVSSIDGRKGEEQTKLPYFFMRKRLFLCNSYS